MISLARIRAIVRKDLIDAVRQGRIVVLLLTPLLLAFFYNATLRETPRIEVKMAYAAPDGPAFVQRLVDRSQASVDLRPTAAGSLEEVRDAVRRRDADVGLVLPAGFEAQVAAGASPAATLVAPEGGSTAATILATTLDGAVRELAAQRPAAQLRRETVDRGGQILLSAVGPRAYFVLGAIVMMLGMVGLSVVPIVLTEESEKRTLDALLLVGSYLDVIVAKALFGLVLVALMLATMLGLTRLAPEDGVAFFGAVAVFAVTMIGFGVFLGGMLRTAQQVSTWGAFLLIPVVGPGFAAGVPVPDWAGPLLAVLPSSAAVRLMANGITGKAVYSEVALAYLVLAAWAVVAYGLVAWRLARRED